MVDALLIQRLDWFLAVLTLWLFLTLVVASFALLLFNVAVGLLSLATVILTSVVAVQSYLRSTDDTPDVEVAVR